MLLFIDSILWKTNLVGFAMSKKLKPKTQK